MRNLLTALGVAAGLTFAAYAGFAPASDAGWGPPFACGAGPNTSQLNWDGSIPDPSAKAPVLTGILADGAKAEEDAKEYSVKELENAKPLLVYYVRQGMTDASHPEYKFSQSFEVKVLAKDKIVDQINANWRAKKVAIDLEASTKDPADRTRIEFWSYTGTKMGVMKADSRVSSRSMVGKLKKYEAKNKSLCKVEIKRIQKAEKAAASAAKKTAKK